jgi:abscisic-aldehyde oxidase
LAKIKSLSFRENVTPTGVFAVLTFKDIPQQGQNIGSKTLFGPGPLFADELTRCAGQRIALVVTPVSSSFLILARISLRI